jgi:hypothetical protein
MPNVFTCGHTHWTKVLQEISISPPDSSDQKIIKAVKEFLANYSGSIIRDLNVWTPYPLSIFDRS